MARIQKKVTLTGEFQFSRKAFGGYRDEEVHVYKMTDNEGVVYVWKTTAFLKAETTIGDKVDTYFPHKGDVLAIRATIKGETEYKGELQTEINRVIVDEIISKYQEAVVEAKAEKQKQSIDVEAGDRIVEMFYRSYKQHYADCETISGSYDEDFGTIKVIIRAGRMKPSGTRGKHYKGYELVNEKGEHVTYRAVSEDNALKRAHKNYPDEVWECIHVYDYRHYHRIW